MRFFYSSYRAPHVPLNGMGSFLLGITAFSLFILCAGFVIFVLKYIFIRSAALGFLFLFFGLPVLIRVLFVMYFGILSFIVSFFAADSSKGENDRKEDRSAGGVIDVKHKVLK